MFRRDRENRTPTHAFGTTPHYHLYYFLYILLSMNSVSGIQAKIRGIEPLPTGLEAVALPLYYISVVIYVVLITAGKALFTSENLRTKN
jgi:hypothetical protein